MVDNAGLAVWIAIWVLGWGVAAEFVPHCLPASSKEHENAPNWVAQCTLAFLRSVFVAVGALVAGHHERILDHCGFSFFAFEIVDLVIGSVFKLHTVDMLLHHTVHIAAGGLIWFNGLYTLARPMMTQEMSSIFLNMWMLGRHRGPPGKSDWLFVCFALAFAIFRLGIGSMACLDFYRGGTHPTLGYLVLGGAGFQWYWGYTISLKVYQQITAGAEDHKQGRKD